MLCTEKCMSRVVSESVQTEFKNSDHFRSFRSDSLWNPRIQINSDQFRSIQMIQIDSDRFLETESNNSDHFRFLRIFQM